jgi:hypothetical protein
VLWIGISAAAFSDTARSSMITLSLKKFKAPFGKSSQSEGGIKTAQCDTERWKAPERNWRFSIPADSGHV